MPPDELLGHLDELIDRIDRNENDLDAQDGEPVEEAAGVTGATCLYAVYDPVSGRCTLASAGHPGPALVHPDGRVEFPELPTGLPLGVGGMPFETTELMLPEGSRSRCSPTACWRTATGTSTPVCGCSAKPCRCPDAVPTRRAPTCWRRCCSRCRATTSPS